MNPLLFAAKKAILFASEGRSSKWSGVRTHFLYGRTCAACGGGKNLEAHHIRPFHLYPGLELDEGNLLCLCEYPSHNCHIRVGHSFDWKSYNPDSIQDAALQLKRVIGRLYT